MKIMIKCFEGDWRELVEINQSKTTFPFHLISEDGLDDWYKPEGFTDIKLVEECSHTGFKEFNGDGCMRCHYCHECVEETHDEIEPITFNKEYSQYISNETIIGKLNELVDEVNKLKAK